MGFGDKKKNEQPHFAPIHFLPFGFPKKKGHLFLK